MMSTLAAQTTIGERRFWSVENGDSPVIGTAIHDGHGTRRDVGELMALSGEERLREEDPFTADMISGLVNQIVVHHSRFEVDLNRANDEAIYLEPEQAWGLKVWADRPSEEVISQSLRFHDDYYAMLEQSLKRLENRHGAFVLLDVHSYNHRRSGPDGKPTSQDKAPDVNIGTISMDRDRWADVVDATIRHFRAATIGGRQLDVRENIAFQGKGEQTRFVHERFPEHGCAIAIEFKKIFMDEWTGQPDSQMIQDIRDAITWLEPVLEDLLGARK
ncbi:N-formylglutamate amidohydrolase [Agrobacterium rubi]|uniref:N-formylglutamate amidohydrolase n=2 Tax=Agrobacterium rubi TaxID=28099 RepID=A0AAE7R7T2_9HYPH|nr:N-formylglutamate amidohydrolase [Agrobacterium rubi]NTF04609.1 N-formylglutamate amidohydrolase [Agrobacterium rubi]NTF39171.1 N-formylglutamate amidohydrolase [Agrobacterium rubi]OCJ51319.1 N-formylglutamate amidohydrolase [Agrobacterium rubi]QTG02819.1 N-formylglutamate amidohydrolase [Agrobacterium rubi]